MRISDWSSDVCSSDLCRDGALRPNGRAGARCDVARLFCEAGRGSHGRGGACTRASHPICAAAIRTLTVVLPCDPRMTRPRSWDSLALSTSHRSTEPSPDERSEEHTSELQSLMR